MRQRFAEVMPSVLQHDGGVVLLLADLSAKLFEATKQRFPDRVVNVGIREQLMIDLAGGLALGGMRPVVHSFAPFLIERPFEQIKISLNHQGVGAVLVSAGASFDIAGGGRTHQAPGDVALLGTLPDWTVWVPGHPSEAEVALRRAIASDGLHYVRLSNITNAVPVDTEGRITVLRRGAGPVIVAIGPVLDAALAAARAVDATVLYTMVARPFDAAGLTEHVSRDRNQVILIEPTLEGTSSSEIRRSVSFNLRLLEIGVSRSELHAYGNSAQHQVAHHLDSDSIERRIDLFLRETHE